MWVYDYVVNWVVTTEAVKEVNNKNIAILSRS